MNKDKRTNDQKQHPSSSELERNRNKQAVDKAPGEARGKGEQIKPADLDGKKVDADPSQERGRQE